jgi:hypothetical protein
MDTVKQKMLDQFNQMIDYVKADVRASLVGNIDRDDVYEAQSSLNTLIEYIESRDNLLNNKPMNNRIKLEVLNNILNDELD